jgi:hypothetical protein
MYPVTIAMAGIVTRTTLWPLENPMQRPRYRIREGSEMQIARTECLNPGNRHTAVNLLALTTTMGGSTNKTPIMAD